MKKKIIRYNYILIVSVFILATIFSSENVLNVYKVGLQDKIDAIFIFMKSSYIIELSPIRIFIWGGSLVTIILFAINSIFFSYRINQLLVKPLNKIILSANEISKGNYSTRCDLGDIGELIVLVKAFNNMANKLEINILELNDKKIEIQSIIDSISNGVIAVDRNCNIILINPFAYDLFHIEKDLNLKGERIITHIRNSDINKLLSDTIENNVYLEQEINFSGDRILLINTSPIKTIDGRYKNQGGVIVIQDITKTKKLEGIRTEFVSNVTHELKTPLTSIRGFIETLKAGSIKDPKRAIRFLDIIDIEAERLSLLISDILQLSEIESKMLDVEMENVNFTHLVMEVLEISENIAKEKEVYLVNNVNSNLVIIVNKNRIKQMLINLINNAINYNYINGSVSVYGHLEPGKMVIRVKDTGIGINEEYYTRIFERFYRIDKGRSKDSGGTGLGLSIVKHIVQLHNGDIKVVSEPQKGTEFIISLPQ